MATEGGDSALTQIMFSQVLLYTLKIFFIFWLHLGMQGFPDWNQTHAPWGGSMENPTTGPPGKSSNFIVSSTNWAKRNMALKDVSEESKVHQCKYYFYSQGHVDKALYMVLPLVIPSEALQEYKPEQNKFSNS